jgi:tight adherence protein B
LNHAEGKEQVAMDRMFSPELLPIFLGLAGLLLLLIVLLVWQLRRPGEKEVASRLTEFVGPSGAQPAANPRQALERIDRVVAQSKRGGNIQRDLARADVKLTVAEFIIIKIVPATGEPTGSRRARPAASPSQR